MNTEVKTVVVSKADRALAIFNEELAAGEEGHRARTIKRFKAELEMGAPGASTYYQNSKKRANGEKVVNYRPKAKAAATDTSSDEVPESFEVELADGTIQCFLSQQEADDFAAANADKLAVKDAA